VVIVSCKTIIGKKYRERERERERIQTAPGQFWCG
jgi:hypothetical protein